jgi:hypothetical protein
MTETQKLVFEVFRFELKVNLNSIEKSLLHNYFITVQYDLEV